MTNQNLYQIGLTMINGIGDILGRQLLQAVGSAEAVFTEKPRILEKIPGIGQALANEISQSDALKRAEKEIAFIEKNKLSCFFLTDKDYPVRLRECTDAPLVLYFKGKADLNAKRIISIVGTRKASNYGRELTEKLISDLSVIFPDLLIVSGLAYGIDIIGHRSALKNQLPTVGVLAHGLDRLYPPSHRSTAVEMLEQGGLLTDFPSGTNPDKPNFIKRNRIIAGLADTTIIIESANRGGSLITADIAFSYGRDVFAFPGRTTDALSEGCNRIIRQNKAGLITCANDLIEALSWDVQEKKIGPPVQAKLFFHENEEINRIYNLLKEKTELHINELSAELGLPVFKLSPLLFELEMDGIVKTIPGNRYRLA
ncbi:DNA processing protein [Parabacteroides sp. PF5-5]|uniref:DNA-processing protein DprA n=1 Tax=unclassified Parabacteroides TaxID=2649774 RepID=UPI002474C09A|nr:MULTISPECIES: DNA-processing protein DprA [unclassified Parabacteroides]MDH6306465.1 DNA processing protein [Parabacteroides sp. PH5-39]MDH6317383.1 DNA processing protein [Parabacteroides sp. PF5-13]MDH6321176.1 DNA processing protein [Parabacteroides sp. PH5-13]MDH6324908.1 DNA processing protein [Parabacteroides sp. PH5-8]MDH6328568.1 DNA processing protein [Parabacteroides sp. PH5-41]